MQVSGEPVEFWILDFSKVFSRAFGEGGDGTAGTKNGRWEMSSSTPNQRSEDFWMIIKNFAFQ